MLITQILHKDIIDKNRCAIQMVTDYAKVAGIIERTHTAMGKKATFKVSTSSTFNPKLNIDVFASAH